MGKTSRIFCNECDEKIDINLGPGMMYWSLDNLALPEDEEYGAMFKMRDYIREEYTDVSEKLEESIYVCDSCKHWENRLSVKIIVKGNNKNIVFEYSHTCPKCNDVLKEITEEHILEYIKCPKCNSSNLSVDEMWMLWD